MTEREWIDLVLYWPNLPLIVKRAWRDEAYIAQLEKEVARFNDELAEVVAQVEAYERDLPPCTSIRRALEAIS